MNFLPDATDFTDMEVKVRPDLRTDGAQRAGDFTPCPLCRGYGGWNLRLNAYPAHPGQAPRTPEQRHFRALCRQCWGWGWVEAKDATCIHAFREVKPDQPFRCWHMIRCTACGETRSYSSDD